MEKSIISAILQQVVKRLVDADYEFVYETDQDKRILPDEIGSAIENYPGKLTYPPESAFTSFEYYGSEQEPENQVEFTLWYDNKPSDLTLSLTVYKPDTFGLDDIRVM